MYVDPLSFDSYSYNIWKTTFNHIFHIHSQETCKRDPQKKISSRLIAIHIMQCQLAAHIFIMQLLPADIQSPFDSIPLLCGSFIRLFCGSLWQVSCECMFVSFRLTFNQSSLYIYIYILDLLSQVSSHICRSLFTFTLSLTLFLSLTHYFHFARTCALSSCRPPSPLRQGESAPSERHNSREVTQIDSVFVALTISLSPPFFLSALCPSLPSHALFFFLSFSPSFVWSVRDVCCSVLQSVELCYSVRHCVAECNFGLDWCVRNALNQILFSMHSHKSLLQFFCI